MGPGRSSSLFNHRRAAQPDRSTTIIRALELVAAHGAGDDLGWRSGWRLHVVVPAAGGGVALVFARPVVEDGGLAAGREDDVDLIVRGGVAVALRDLEFARQSRAADLVESVAEVLLDVTARLHDEGLIAAAGSGNLVQIGR